MMVVNMGSKEVKQRQLELNNKERQRELIQINHNQRQAAKPIILLTPNQIFQVWETTDKESFTFMLLSKYLNKKMKEMISYEFVQPLTVGFSVERTVIRFYPVQEIVLKEKACLITLKCFTKAEKELLMGRFTACRSH